MPSSLPIPILTCGAYHPTALAVHEALKPEYDVLYAAFSLPATLIELPLILSNQPPDSFHTQISHNTFLPHRRPVAVVLGAGYNDEAVEALYTACLTACGGENAGLGVVFLRADNALTERLVAEGKAPAKRTEGYAEAIVERVKAKLRELGVAEMGSARAEDIGQLFWY